MQYLNGLVNKLKGDPNDPAALPGNTGVSGGMPVLGAPPVADAPAAAPAPALDYSRLNAGFDRNKLNDPNKHDAKYDMARTLAGFDPSKGLTPEAIAGLNGLGYGTFSGQGDKLSLSGLTDAGKKAGLVGDYKDADFNEGFKTGNGKWSYQDPAFEAMQGAQGAPSMNAGRPAFAGSTIAPMLQGDAQAGIQQALGAMGGQESGYLQKLIAQLQQGAQ